ncbi:MAG: hypothetical protein HFJ86_02480 [Oscillospiraceae bacterium]|jgi:hypothetical protein|nr:hypothetical protein [Oscillospiraceae bacterium]
MRKRIFLVVSVGILVFLLCSCGTGSWGLERKAHQYLTSRYSAEFKITDTEDIVNETGPIPVLIPSHHWRLTVESTQFPGETFFVYYRKREENQWQWSDNYYSLLFRDEVEKNCREFAESFFPANCTIKSVWGTSPWPDGAGENSTIREWMDAGGKITRLELWFCDFLPNDDTCALFSDAVTDEFPNLSSILFLGLTQDGYQAAETQPKELLSIWNANPDWRIGQIRYDCAEDEMIHME